MNLVYPEYSTQTNRDGLTTLVNPIFDHATFVHFFANEKGDFANCNMYFYYGAKSIDDWVDTFILQFSHGVGLSEQNLKSLDRLCRSVTLFLDQYRGGKRPAKKPKAKQPKPTSSYEDAMKIIEESQP